MSTSSSHLNAMSRGHQRVSSALAGTLGVTSLLATASPQVNPGGSYLPSINGIHASTPSTSSRQNMSTFSNRFRTMMTMFPSPSSSMPVSQPPAAFDREPRRSARGRPLSFPNTGFDLHRRSGDSPTEAFGLDIILSNAMAITNPHLAIQLERPQPIPELSSQVEIKLRYCIFHGHYSSVYRGVYRPKGSDITKQVTVKVIHSLKEKSDKAMRRKALRERETWWRLSHPNILPLYGFIEVVEHGNYGALVSPWCKNGNAERYMAERDVLPQKRVELLIDVAKGLEYLHTFHPTIIHGDLKPTNVLINDDGRAQLCDFGLVRWISSGKSSTGLTTTSSHTGTIRYLAYELIASEENPLTTTASDVYALGCIGLEFIFSQAPYSYVKNYFRLDLRICREIEQKRPPASRPTDISGSLLDFWALLELCWDIEPGNRPSAGGICTFLTNCGDSVIESLTHRTPVQMFEPPPSSSS